jgi:hypothetical protein
MYQKVTMFTVEGPVSTYYDVVADGKYLGDVGEAELQFFLDNLATQTLEVVPASD